MRTGISASRPFAAHHPWDRYAIPLFVALVWTTILMGFVPEMIGQLRKHQYVYPPVTHLHAVVQFGWLMLLTAQTTLIRTGNVSLHRRLGVLGACLIPVIVVLGIAVAVSMLRRFSDPNFPPVVLSERIADMCGFGALAGAAVAMRKSAAAHKRLMLLANFHLAAAGFGRWWGDGGYLKFLGDGFLGQWGFDYLGVVVLIALLGAYDLMTRRRLHPAYIRGAAGIIGLELLGVYVSDAAWWLPISIRLIGR